MLGPETQGQPSKNTCFVFSLGQITRRGAFLEIIEKQFFCGSRNTRCRCMRSSKTCLLFVFCGSTLPEIRTATGWNRLVHVCVCVCSDHDPFCGVAGCCIGTIGFQIMFHSAALVGHKKKSFLGGCWHFVSAVSVRFAMICVDIMSDGLHCVSVLVERCFDIFFVDEFGHCCASKRSKCQIVCLLTAWLLIGVVVAPSLVTTLDSRRCSVLCSQRKTHCSGQPRTPSVQRRPPPLFLPSHPSASTHHKKTRFSDDLRECHSVFLDLVSGFFCEPSRTS